MFRCPRNDNERHSFDGPNEIQHKIRLHINTFGWILQWRRAHFFLGFSFAFIFASHVRNTFHPLTHQNKSGERNPFCTTTADYWLLLSMLVSLPKWPSELWSYDEICISAVQRLEYWTCVEWMHNTHTHTWREKDEKRSVSHSYFLLKCCRKCDFSEYTSRE